MNEPTDAPNQHQLLTAVRVLVQTAQEPLAPLAEILQAPDQLLADLTPALAVVAFSPFAGLPVSSPEAQQSVPKPPLRSTGAPPVAPATGVTASQSALPPVVLPSPQPLAPPVASANALNSTTVTPVFVLPSQPRTATSTVSPLQRAAAFPAQPVAQPAMLSPIAMAANTTVKADHGMPLLESGQSGLAGRPNALSDDKVGDNHEIAAPPLAAMTLLATIVDSLLTTASSARLEPAARQESGMTGPSSMPSIPAPSLLPASGHLPRSVDHELALQPLRSANQPVAASTDPSSFAALPIDAPTAPFASLLAEWPAARGENQPINQSTNQPINQRGFPSDSHPTPDPWTLAQLINDVLAEEARRHGVDLS